MVGHKWENFHQRSFLGHAGANKGKIMGTRKRNSRCEKEANKSIAFAKIE
jgi:hypothetical protein